MKVNTKITNTMDIRKKTNEELKEDVMAAELLEPHITDIMWPW